MAITKEIETQALVLPDGQVQIRETTTIFEDGVELTKVYKKRILDVGDDAASEVQLVKDIASSVHTPERANARATVKAAQGQQ